ncbi:MAG: hypothetical protein K8T90_18320 [Planctomycetes bacterium]|nr:hypothetical protein [Planctomycetota bacterium]
MAVALIFSTPSHVTGAVVSAGCAVAGSLWIVRHLWLGGVEIQWERGTLAPGRRAVFFVATTDGSSRLLGARFLCVASGRTGRRCGGNRIRWG